MSDPRRIYVGWPLGFRRGQRTATSSAASSPSSALSPAGPRPVSAASSSESSSSAMSRVPSSAILERLPDGVVDELIVPAAALATFWDSVKYHFAPLVGSCGAGGKL
ncbi:unnamed protein product [Prorocentrum cordatum]|uniref:Uncharacterized protein n=1 Tax=Prorocentrum cordatum TaxID=2364126 RepID=A0ABN9SZ73_9DINO|nr:unnamed protein product [Polarella glacialis]